MGTINYGRSKYITLGIYPVDSYDLRQNEDYVNDVKNMSSETYEPEEITDELINGYLEDDAELFMEDDYENIRSILDKHNFNYFNITIKSGYYEGFYLDIEDNYDWLLDSYKDRAEINKEITEIKEMFIYMAGCGMKSVYPGWCTSYADYQETIKDIKEAIKEMRQGVKETMTWRQYNRKRAAEVTEVQKKIKEAA